MGDPDRVLSDLVEDYAEAAEATAAQRTAMTPSPRAGAPAGSDSPIGAVPLAIVAGLVVLTLAVAIAEGGVLWLLPAVTWAGAAVWLAVHLPRRRD